MEVRGGDCFVPRNDRAGGEGDCFVPRNDRIRRINEEMKGRIAIFEDEIPLFLRTVAGVKIYVEVGCLWGGTAILAALAGEVGRVITIDKAEGGYWETGDTSLPGYPVVTLRAVLDNFAHFRVGNRISLYVGQSDPWPLPLDMTPDVMLIDGDHSYEGCLRDWENAKRFGGDVVMVHDYGSGRHPGVQRVVDEHVLLDDGWKLVDQAGTLVVVERTGDGRPGTGEGDCFVPRNDRGGV